MYLECRNLSAAYSQELIIKEIDLSITRGEIVTIIGPNGSGKSTLLKAISGNMPLAGGSVSLEGRDVKKVRPKVLARELSFMPQVFGSMPGFTVKDIVGYGRFPHLGLSGRMKPDDIEIINWAIDSVGLNDFVNRPVNNLSGGEFQRARIAMAIAQETELVILDEPTTFLDINHQLQVLDLIKRLNSEMGKTVLMVLHDINQAARFSDTIVVMDRGSKHSEGKPENILTDSILRNVFKINARIFTDENHGRYFLPDTVCGE